MSKWSQEVGGGERERSKCDGYKATRGPGEREFFHRAI